MLPPREGVLFTEDPEVVGLSTHTSSTEGQSFSAGTSGMVGSSAGHATNHMQSSSEAEMDSTSLSSADTEGWSRSVQEGHGVAETQGASEAWTRGTNRSITRGKTVTNSEQVTDGYSDTVGHTDTQGIAFTEGETVTRGESVTLSPFYEYRREEIETPTFMTPEEQKLLVMQKLARIPKMHFLVKAPESSDCVIRAPYVGDPMITQRRLAAGLESVYSAMPCYTTLEQRGHGDSAVHDDHGADEVIDVVEVQEVCTSESVKALPSPIDDAEVEAALWERWVPGSRHRSQEKNDFIARACYIANCNFVW
jgi:hypothetical protein